MARQVTRNEPAHGGSRWHSGSSIGRTRESVQPNPLGNHDERRLAKRRGMVAYCPQCGGLWHGEAHWDTNRYDCPDTTRGDR